jgi:hypothetical protein
MLNLLQYQQRCVERSKQHIDHLSEEKGGKGFEWTEEKWKTSASSNQQSESFRNKLK